MAGPASHENEKIKDQPITIAIRINRIERTEPVAAESIVEQLGFDSIDTLKQYVLGMLESRASHAQREAMRAQVSEYLLEQTDLELPENLTGRQTERLLHRRKLEWSSMGLPDDEVAQRVAEARSGSEDEARRQLKMFFILNQAAKKLEVEVTDAEINGVIAQLATEQGRRPQKMRQDMQRSGELEHMGLLVRERKTLDRILESADVTEIEAGEKPKKASTTKKKRSTKKKPAAKSTTKPAAKSSRAAKTKAKKGRSG
jgi:trigger factor